MDRDGGGSIVGPIVRVLQRAGGVVVVGLWVLVVLAVALLLVLVPPTTSRPGRGRVLGHGRSRGGDRLLLSATEHAGDGAHAQYKKDGQ